jgi:hypothetical protein
VARLLPLALGACLLLSCGGTSSPTPDVIATQVAQAQFVAATLTASAPSATSTPTPTPPPTPNPTEAAAALDDAFVEALSVGCRPVREQLRELAARAPDPSTDRAAYCLWIDEYLRVTTKDLACARMLPKPANPTLVEARRWVEISGEKWVEAITLASYSCSGQESTDTVLAALREAGMAGDRANGFLALYFEQHPEDTPADWQY